MNLNLTLTAKWFWMIYNRNKLDEYREIKPYWRRRLMREHELGGHESLRGVFKHYDTITFTNGYGAHRPSMVVECKGISIGTGNPEWGAPAWPVFKLELGDIISSKNIPIQ